ncbi:hypothetical protein Tsumi_06610 [Porphyromonas miyakawae]|uniref:Uncharacterized protein n=1 Tax=Porphyromonas miyakawae TaxID=3137470 RepID=A0ABQ0E1F8_9PORP
MRLSAFARNALATNPIESAKKEQNNEIRDLDVVDVFILIFFNSTDLFSIYHQS